MLELRGISKTYKNGDVYAAAIKDVDLKFEKKEFVSVLGGSGCGKSTLLNIIGGLMQPTYGELIINGISTKDYTPIDWDSYRNNYIGFVFQSYHLISHLNIIENVELSLTLSGISAKERRKKALEALEKVDMSKHVDKKPNQLSNGQMQRVAIARAIVHDPEIILADEPTGALDSVNSKQVMELLYKLSENKLVIMVTHNEELAQQYSTRIIKISDGIIAGDEKNLPSVSIKQFNIDNLETKDETNSTADLSENASFGKADETDSDETSTHVSLDGSDSAINETYTEVNTTEEAMISYELDSKDDEKSEIIKTKKRRKKAVPTMPFLSAIKISLKNLSAKIGRTIMTVVAAAIAIVSIALVLGFNNGFNTYISTYEKQTLATYPITVQKANSTFTDLFENLDNINSFNPSQINFGQVLSVLSDENVSADEYTEAKEIYTNLLLGALIQNRSDLTKDNDTAALKEYVESNFNSDWGFAKYDYDINPNIYRKNEDGSYTKLAPFTDRLTEDITSLGGYIDSNMYASLSSSLSSITIWEQMPSIQTVQAQYDLIGGSYPDASDDGAYDVMLVVDKYNSINDYVLYGLGFLEINTILQTMLNSSISASDFTYSFSDFIGKEFQVLVPTEYYNYNAEKGRYIEITDDEELYEKINNKSITIRISGILRQKPEIDNGCLKGTICYTEDFTKEYIEKNSLTELVLKQMEEYNKYLDGTTDAIKSVISGKVLTVDPKVTSELNFFVYLKNTLKIKDVNSPDYIYFFASSVEAKSKITNLIENFNSQNESSSVTYKDESTAIVNSLSSTVKTITYILMAVTLISVVVALFMIAILMYSTVQDRTQEIGILRSIGARKLDIMRIFNTESLLLGFFASIVGTILAYIFSLPINALLNKFLAITSLISIAWWHVFMLIGLSMLLTLISGLMPAIYAAKKDPVVALRTE